MLLSPCIFGSNEAGLPCIYNPMSGAHIFPTPRLFAETIPARAPLTTKEERLLFPDNIRNQFHYHHVYYHHTTHHLLPPEVGRQESDANGSSPLNEGHHRQENVLPQMPSAAAHSGTATACGFSRITFSISIAMAAEKPRNREGL